MATSGGATSTPPAKKEKEKDKKDKKPKKEKKEGWHLYNLFRKTKGFDRNVSAIPSIVREPIDWLTCHNALGEEGIFRVPGSATEIKELKLRYDKGKKVSLEEIQNPHTVAGLLKVFFRELPEPILTFELFEAFLAAIKPESLATKLEYLGKVLEALPAGNKLILECLMEFLYQVSLHKSNCMSISNIAIVFAPNLMRPKVERMDSILTNSTAVCMAISLMIQHHEVLFHGKEFTDQESTQVPVMSPQLISLKAAQAMHGGSKASTGDISTSPRQDGVTQGSDESPDEVDSAPTTPKEKDASNTGTNGKPKKSGPKSRRDPNKTPMKRSQTVSTPSGGGSPVVSSPSTPHANLEPAPATTRRKHKREKSSGNANEFDFTSQELDSAASGLNASDSTNSSNGTKLKRSRSKRPASDQNGADGFYDTLKKGTMRLVTSLLEEQELVLEMVELDQLSPEEKRQVTDKVAKKISESKSLRDNNRKQRQVQRTQTSNFSKLRDMSKSQSATDATPASKVGLGKKSNKDADKSASTSSTASTSSPVKKKPKKSISEIGVAPIPFGHLEPTASTPTMGTPNSSQEIEKSSSIMSNDSESSQTFEEGVGGYVEAVQAEELDPELLRFEDELDRQFSMEDYDSTIIKKLKNEEVAEEGSDSDSSDSDYEKALAFIPPPLPPPLPPADYVGPHAHEDYDELHDAEEEDRVVEAVMEGDMQQFNEYLGALKNKNKLERSKSKKRLMARMSINLQVSPVVAAASAASNPKSSE